jgi:2-dehydro-3-deoxyphosphogluconate aldolase / (4S)-4-hydroxy-2-oxoglutarate aldolase
MADQATTDVDALEAALQGCRVIPVLTLSDAEEAVTVAGALAEGGLKAVEVTLRTASALDCIAAIAHALPQVSVGAGTVLEQGQALAAAEAGARFLVSPGATEGVLAAFAAAGLPALPGAATASEAMRLAEAGFRRLKFFPAEPMGGLATLKALAPVLPTLRFCPTGGIDAERAPAYLALPTVFAVGGSWVVPRGAQPETITRLAEAAAALG